MLKTVKGSIDKVKQMRNFLPNSLDQLQILPGLFFIVLVLGTSCD